MTPAAKKRLTRLLLAFFLLVLAFPATVLADNPPAPPVLSSLSFVSNADYNLVVGLASSIDFRLTNNDGSSHSGSVTAYLYDPDRQLVGSYTLNGQGSYSLSNIILDSPGTYSLYLSDGTGSAGGSIIVTNGKIEIVSGSLVVNMNSSVTAKLEDANGNPLPRKSVDVDASGAGLGKFTYQTAYDGTFVFTLTPTSKGTVNFLLGGHIIGSMPVAAAYTRGGRLGAVAADNSALSVAVAQQGWASSDAVLLTRDDDLADSMVAVPLAKKYDAPILMTPSKQLAPAVLAEIQSLKATRVYIIGGTGAVSEEVANALRAQGLSVFRFGGADRYETAVQIAAIVGSPGTVYLAYGEGEPDAIAASSLAAQQHIPILLTGATVLPDSTQRMLASLGASKVVLLGGTGVISKALEQQLAASYSVQRWGGPDRYATEQAIFQNTVHSRMPAYFVSALVSPADVASGNPRGDALLAAALAAHQNGFIVALPPDNLPMAMYYFLLYNKGYISSGTVVGNTAAITQNLEQQLQDLTDH